MTDGFFILLDPYCRAESYLAYGRIDVRDPYCDAYRRAYLDAVIYITNYDTVEKGRPLARKYTGTKPGGL